MGALQEARKAAQTAEIAVRELGEAVERLYTEIEQNAANSEGLSAAVEKLKRTEEAQARLNADVRGLEDQKSRIERELQELFGKYTK